MNPDLVVWDGLAIADVKYKTSDEDLNRADLYQSVAFATGFGCGHAAILAFRDGPVPSYGELGVGGVTVRHLWWPADADLDARDAASQLIGDFAMWLGGVDHVPARRSA